ncbi:MAG: DUF554 domain-containing protein [Clostridia bacterium]|nr:DUF554 domain-containing protein [Clostridia bacterium]
MHGLGTIINAAAIILGGFVGMFFGKKLPDRFRQILITACGVSTLFLGIGGAMEKMLKIYDGELSASGTMMIIGSFVLGAALGELLDIDRHTEQFGAWLKKKTKSEKDNSFADGFVNASLTVCVGAMAIVGSIQDGIYGDYSTLTAKAVLDFTIVLVMAASMGKGCIFSALPVAVFQGIVTALARLAQPLFTEQALNNLSLTGSILIFCVGVNLIWGKKIKVANLLPTIIFAVLFAFIDLPFLS